MNKIFQLFYGLVLVSAVTLFFNSCSSVPDGGTGKLLSSGPNHGSSSRILLSDLIDDPRMVSMIDETLEISRELEAALINLEASRWEARTGLSAFMPEIGLDLTPGINNMGFDSSTGKRKTESALNTSLNINWNLDVWGMQVDRQKTVNRDLKSMAENYEGMINRLAAQFCLAMIERAVAMEVVALEEERLALMTQLCDMSRQRFLTGIGSSDDVSYSESRKIMAEAAYETSLSDLKATELNMQFFLYRSLNQADLQQLPETIPAITLPEIESIDDYLFNRPDVRMAMNNAENSILLKRIAVKSVLPSLSLTGSLSKEFLKSETGGDGKPQWFVRGTVYWPLFSGGRNYHQIRADNSRERAFSAEAANIVQAARAEIISLKMREERIAIQEESLKKALIEIETILEMSEKSYSSGLLGIREYINAQEEVLAMRLRIIEAQAEKSSNRINLALAIGADWR